MFDAYYDDADAYAYEHNADTIVETYNNSKKYNVIVVEPQYISDIFYRGETPEEVYEYISSLGGKIDYLRNGRSLWFPYPAKAYVGSYMDYLVTTN